MKKVSVDLFRAAPYMLMLVVHKDALFLCKFTLADLAALSAKKDSNYYMSNDLVHGKPCQCSWRSLPQILNLANSGHKEVS